MSKSNKDLFFKAASAENLNNKIISAAKNELAANKMKTKSQFWLVYLVPITTAIIAIFLVYFKLDSNVYDNEFHKLDENQLTMAVELFEDPDSLDVVDELKFLEEIEYISEYDGGDNV